MTEMMAVVVYMREEDWTTTCRAVVLRRMTE
jgi:hypothetical protein